MVPVVSIIVPIFNAERYLSECIQSVISQSYSDWEMILINDGSVDDSLIICQSYSQIDMRIKLISKVNTGVSDTRNIGIEAARGKYIIFLDADDYWCNSMALEKLVYTAEYHNLDVVRGEYKAVTETGADLYCRDVPSKSMLYSEQVISSSEFLNYAIHGEYFLVLSLIRHEILQDVRFDTQRIFLEDVLFYSNLLLKPLRTMYLPRLRFYAYRKYELSASSRVNPRKLKDAFGMCHEFHRLVLLAKDSIIRRVFMENSIKMYYFTLDTISLDEYYDNRKLYISEFNLSQLRRTVVSWMREYNLFFFTPIYYLSPELGIALFRIRHFLGEIKRCICNMI